MKSAETGSAPFGFNIVGYTSSHTGLGVAARAMVQLILDKGYRVATFDVGTSIDRKLVDGGFLENAVSKIDDLPFDLNVLCLSVNELADFVQAAPAVLLKNDALNFGFIFWELPVLPSVVAEALQFLDGVITVSDFCRYVLDVKLSNVYSLRSNYPIVWPQGIRPLRSRFGLPEDSVIFINSFDPYSDMDRKNPFGVIDAFQLAFKNDENVNLVLKLNSAHETKIPAIMDLKRRSAEDSRIRLLIDSFDYVDVLALYASCDVFVSLHRAEGLGLGLMEAMMLGKPTIATAWSGNMSFMNHLNACLVRYKLVPVHGSVWVYQKEYLGQDTVWAEPDIQDAAIWMKRLASDKSLRETIGQKALLDMKSYSAVARKGEVVDEMVNIWDQRRQRSDSRRDRELEVREMRKRMWYQQMSYPKRVAMAVRDQVDRHVTWRFRL